VTFLNPIEEAYLSGMRDFTKVQQRYIRYLLKKKLRLLDKELTSSGLLPDSMITAAPAASLRGCYGPEKNIPTLVAQPGRALELLSEKDKIMRKSLRGIWTPRPLPLGSRLFEPYLTKVTQQ
jgi:hypothetical protein